MYLVNLDDFCGVFSTKDKAVEACLRWSEKVNLPITEFSDEENSGNFYVTVQLEPPYASASYLVEKVEIDDFDNFLKDEDWF